MSEGTLKTIVVLRSNQFNFSETEDDGSPPAGKAVATYIMHAMSNHGCPALFDDPVSGEGGWSWVAEVGRIRFTLFVHWAPIGEPPQDCWVVQPGLMKGIFRTLFGRATKPEELTPVCDILHRVLDTNPAFSSVEWLTMDEFREAYWLHLKMPCQKEFWQRNFNTQLTLQAK